MAVRQYLQSQADHAEWARIMAARVVPIIERRGLKPILHGKALDCYYSDFLSRLFGRRAMFVAFYAPSGGLALWLGFLDKRYMDMADDIATAVFDGEPVKAEMYPDGSIYYHPKRLPRSYPKRTAGYGKNLPCKEESP